jgi:hypothetical protein
MTYHIGNIAEYQLNIWSHKRGGPDQITLYGTFGVAWLFFVPPGTAAIGSNSMSLSSNPPTFTCFFDDYTWPRVVDMLRNEKPLYFWFEDVSLTVTLTTVREPAGENEPGP